ncbi:MAG: DUF2117 domain-containing protein [Methanotrichaceae archaeon]|nr:DUF2117 domain-containing protein [Methanotrichaceae archaeon]
MPEDSQGFRARIGVVVHGPEIIDSGSALGLINYLKKLGPVTAVLGGTMGRVAVIDAGLEDAISVSPRRRPSQSIQDLEATSDIIFLLNQAKSRESGLAFGAMVAQAAGIGKPLIQIDCGGRFVAVLSGKKGENAGQVASDLGLVILKPPLYRSVSFEKKTTRRTISGVCAGEIISINGTVIGRATECQVEIEAKDGRIVAMKGAQPKQHGLEKLSWIDLEKAIIRSGSIRRSEALPRLGTRKRGREGEDRVENKSEGAVLIDHCAEDAFEAALGASVAVTVGDDTTTVAGDILARLGIPIIGIVDGDLDRLAGSTTMQPGSIVFRVEPGYDDLVGRKIKAEIFKGENRICISAGDLAERVKKLADEHLVEMEQIKSDFL